jgi:chromosomal replication initiation ATPase DnaA
MSSPILSRVERVDERRNWDLDGYRVMRGWVDAYSTTMRAVTGPCRARTLVACRAAIAKELRDKGWTLGQIGELLGSRHHTTVMNLLEAA